MTIASAADRHFLALALEEASLAAANGEVPVGAVLVRNGEVVVRGHNRMVRDGDSTSHAELLVLREGSQSLGSSRLTDCTLYVSLEPCAMCAGAIVLARVGRVVFSAWDDKAGMSGSVGDILRHASLNHRPQVLGGVEPEVSVRLLRKFFDMKRKVD